MLSDGHPVTSDSGSYQWFLSVFLSPTGAMAANVAAELSRIFGSESSQQDMRASAMGFIRSVAIFAAVSGCKEAVGRKRGRK